MYFNNYFSSTIFNLSNIFNGHPNEIKEEVENHRDDKDKINETIFQKLGKNLHENNKGIFGYCKKTASQIVTKIWNKSPILFRKVFYPTLIKEIKRQAITSLTSESTSSGAASSTTKKFILEVLESILKITQY